MNDEKNEDSNRILNFQWATSTEKTQDTTDDTLLLYAHLEMKRKKNPLINLQFRQLHQFSIWHYNLIMCTLPYNAKVVKGGGGGDGPTTPALSKQVVEKIHSHRSCLHKHFEKGAVWSI